MPITVPTSIENKIAEIVTVQENASIERERMVVAAQVETAKAEAAAGVQIAGKLSEILAAQENASIEREKVKSAAEAEVAKTNAGAAVTIVGEAAKAHTETARIVANPQTEGSNTLAIGEMLSEPGSATFEDDSQIVIQNALECGGFYKIMLDNAPQNQQQGIGRVMKEMFHTAKNAGASDEMIAEAPTTIRTKIKATATKGKAVLQQELTSMKEKCVTPGQLAKP